MAGRRKVAGPVVKAVKADIEDLGDLVNVEPSLAQLAIRLAYEIDAGGGEGGKLLPALTRELRQTLAALLAGRMAEEEDDGLGDLASPD